MLKLSRAIVLLFLISVTGCSSDSDPKPEVEEPSEDDDNSPVNGDKPTQVQEGAFSFPGAEGFGKSTTGGRGGKVIKVSNLNDSGAGSLRAAISTSGARIIVFEVSGTIELQSTLNITQPDISIAGQTAPGDGITIKNYPVFIGADNVIIRFLRFRLGNEKQVEGDVIWGRYQKNVIIDHCSMSWCTDEAASFYANQDFTLQWSIISESLNNSLHEKGAHGYGGIWGGDRASFHHNLIAHHKSRNPRFNGWRPGVSNGPYPNEHVDYRNNVIYNWRDESAYGGENGKYNIVNNYYKPGPATPASKTTRIMRVSRELDEAYAPGYGQFFITGNFVYGNTSVTDDNWNGGIIYDGGSTKAGVQLSSAIDYEIATEHSAEQAYEKVLAIAGANHRRDEVDARIVGEVRNGTATFSGSVSGYPGLIDSQEDAGGWPPLASDPAPVDSDGDGMPDTWETAMKLDPAKADANGRDLSTAYDNIEVYVNSIVKEIVEQQR